MHQQINPGMQQFKLALISTEGQQGKTTPSSDGNMVKPTWTTQNGWFTSNINVNMTRPHAPTQIDMPLQDLKRPKMQKILDTLYHNQLEEIYWKRTTYR